MATLSNNDCSAKFMGYFNKGTGESLFISLVRRKRRKATCSPSLQSIRHIYTESEAISWQSACLPTSLSARRKLEQAWERERKKESVCVCPCMCVETYFAPHRRSEKLLPVATDADHCVLILGDRSFRASSIRDDNRYHFRYARARRVNSEIRNFPLARNE